jgi:hypothetical protein
MTPKQAVDVTFGLLRSIQFSSNPDPSWLTHRFFAGLRHSGISLEWHTTWETRSALHAISLALVKIQPVLVLDHVIVGAGETFA